VGQLKQPLFIVAGMRWDRLTFTALGGIAAFLAAATFRAAAVGGERSSASVALSKTRVFPVEQRRRQYPETAGLQTVVQSANLSLAV
jgi:hypothetical protein